MKKKGNILLVLLIVACVAVFYGYRTLDMMRTDNDAPVIYMDAQIPEVSVKDPKSTLLQGISAEDKRDGDVTGSLVVEKVEMTDSDGTLTVSFAAFDRSGNVAKEKREAKYTDYESPKFVMRAPLLFRNGANFDVLQIVEAMDVIDGDIQHRVRATSLTDKSIDELGVHDVQFQVTNSLGDMVTYVFPVEVYDPEPYDATLTLKNYLIYVEKGGTFSAPTYLESFFFRGDEIDLRGNLPYGYSLKTEGTVNTQEPGVYPVEYRVTYTIKHETDPQLDQKYTGYSKLIVVVEG